MNSTLFITQVIAEVETITPDKARYYLSTSLGNRKHDRKLIATLVKSILDGRWVVTNNGVGIDENGNLFDAHHRLEAIIIANVSVEMLVVRNIKPIAKLIVDTGKSRTVSNSLQISNLCIYTNPATNRTVDYSTLIGQLATYVILHRQNSKTVCNGRAGLTNDVIAKFVEENEAELIDTCVFMKAALHKKEYMVVPHFAFIYQMYKFYDEQKITRFINIVKGTEVSENETTCPAMLLKELLIKNKGKKANKFRTTELVGFLMDACNKFMNDEPTKRIVCKEMNSGEVRLKLYGEVSRSGRKFFDSIPY